VHGRGAVSNRTGRFEALEREDFHDGWTAEDAHLSPRVDDTLTPLNARTIVTRNDSPDIGFDRSLNPYVGCSHGCIYCYARPSHAYMGLSPGLDFETRLFYKPNAAALLEAELSKPAYKVDRLHIGANTDPYQPAERALQTTRAVLKVLDAFNHPASLITKSGLIVRDLDLLAPMAERGLVKVMISITTLDRALARAMEPRAATPDRRLWALQTLAAAGVPTAVAFAPAIPGLNDHEMEAVLEGSAAAGAREAMFVSLRLPLEIKALFQEWLNAALPDRARRVMSLVRQMRGGRDYDPQWGSRMRGQGPIADLLSRRFALACDRLGLNQTPVTLRRDLFRPPPKPKDQLELFS
jgi:DNA repair photolyase